MSGCAPNAVFSDAFLRDIPKADVHVHLDGSMRLETLIELARETDGLNLPSYDPAELRDAGAGEIFAPPRRAS